MFTSDTESPLRLRGLFVYAGITIFCFVFQLIYISKSYGVSSPFMRWMFLVPLLGGCLPVGIVLIGKLTTWLCHTTLLLWNSGIAALTAGCLVRGIINISGRSTMYDKFYWWVGGGFLLAAVIYQCIAAVRRKQEQEETG